MHVVAKLCIGSLLFCIKAEVAFDSLLLKITVKLELLFVARQASRTAKVFTLMKTAP